MKKFLKYICRCFYYAIKAFKLSKNHEVGKSWFFLCKDVIQCHNKYFATFVQYVEFKMWSLPEIEKHEVGMRIKMNSTNEWREVYDNDWAFLNKWSQLKWESTMSRRVKRTNAYIKHYGLNKKCWFQYDVKIICEHNSVGHLEVGEHVLFARGVDIDYTGDITIGKDCMLSEGVKVLTHSHDYLDDHVLITTPLYIGEEVVFGVRALIMPGVKRIGRGAMISAGSVVKYEVPPYSIVTGNPAKIVGFRFTPEQIIEYEEERYPENLRLTEEELVLNYKKYFLDRITDISNYLR